MDTLIERKKRFTPRRIYGGVRGVKRNAINRVVGKNSNSFDK